MRFTFVSRDCFPAVPVIPSRTIGRLTVGHGLAQAGTRENVDRCGRVILGRHRKLGVPTLFLLVCSKRPQNAYADDDRSIRDTAATCTHQESNYNKSPLPRSAGPLWPWYVRPAPRPIHIPTYRACVLLRMFRARTATAPRLFAHRWAAKSQIRKVSRNTLGDRLRLHATRLAPRVCRRKSVAGLG